MKVYRTKFKGYLDDLAAKRPSPGGGSAVSLAFCTGVSLIEKAINYSIDLKPKSIQAGNKRLKKQLGSLHILGRKIYPYIDRDGYVFNKIMKNKGKKRVKFIKEGENLIVALGKSCEKVFLLVKVIKSDIKKCINSDLHIGLEFIKVALTGCILNLEANSAMFGTKNKHIDSFRGILKKWQ